jgi:hypothetical protein
MVHTSPILHLRKLRARRGTPNHHIAGQEHSQDFNLSLLAPPPLSDLALGWERLVVRDSTLIEPEWGGEGIGQH